MLGEVMPAEYWMKLRATAIKLLRANGRPRAAEILEAVPWELREGTNPFGDEFAALYWAAPIKRYVEAAEAAESRKDAAAYEQIAWAVSKIATTTYVRFIAVAISVDEGPSVVENPNLAVSTDLVERALNDAEKLLSTSGATSGVDRVHTALQPISKPYATKRASPILPKRA